MSTTTPSEANAMLVLPIVFGKISGAVQRTFYRLRSNPRTQITLERYNQAGPSHFALDFYLPDNSGGYTAIAIILEWENSRFVPKSLSLCFSGNTPQVYGPSPDSNMWEQL